MNRIHRCLGVVAALGGTLLTLAVAARPRWPPSRTRAAGQVRGHSLQVLPSSPGACPAGRSS